MKLRLSLGLCLTGLLVLPGIYSAPESRAQDVPPRRVAFTFDDLPRPGAPKPGDVPRVEAMTRRLLDALQRHKVPAIGFVNENKVQMPGERDARVSLLRMWLDAGFPLGNHTYSHKGLHNTPLREYQDDVVQGEVITRQLMEERGLRLQYFRHPYTRTGGTRRIKDAFEAFLAQRGYSVASFTVENADYMFNAIYLRALEQGDDALAERVRAS